VEVSSFDDLQQQVRAPLVTRSDPAYDGARRVWNGMFDRHPLLIVQPESAAEVAAAIAFAREHDLPLSVKGGGHGVTPRHDIGYAGGQDRCRKGIDNVAPAR
jgi:FAD/FMN-containing dehydrogenase